MKRYHLLVNWLKYKNCTQNRTQNCTQNRTQNCTQIFTHIRVFIFSIHTCIRV